MKRLSLLLAVVALFQLAARGEPSTDERQKKALETLRKRVAEESTHPHASLYAALDTNSPSQAASSMRRVPSYAEMEKQYLEGKISRKQYERYLKENPVDPAAKNQAVNTVPRTNVVRTVPAPGPAATVPTKPAVAAPTPEPTNKLNDVEAKMDELIRQKEARDKALKNAAPAPEPKTKREKLNAILKLYVDEKISEQEYNQRREKIMAEPGD